MNAVRSWPRPLPVAVVAFAIFVPAVAACKKDASATSITAATASAMFTPSKAVAPLPDGEIESAIQRHFQEDALVRAEHFRLAVTGGVVELSGSSSNLLAKERALKVTESIKGVRSVVDQTTVVPVTRSDDQLKIDVTTALTNDPATKSRAVSATVKNGAVSLTGTADSFQQKSLFAEIVKMIPGVKSVQNGAVIKYATDRPASEIEADVKHRIGNDVWLDADPFTVTVTGHAVRLSGIVASVSQRRRAGDDAWVAGVDSVDDAGVTVDWIAEQDQRRVNDFPLKNDAGIAAAVNDAFRLDPRLRTMVPQVKVENGVVMLSGNLESVGARRAAEADATNTLGVWHVRNETMVVPTGAPKDSEIESSVKRALAEDFQLTDAKDIQVSSAKGKVSVKGPVASGFERFNVVKDVGSVPGVNEIQDNLSVKKPIDQIKSDTEDRLYWDPTVERDRITVVVAPDGVATLTGTLDAWSEIRAASDDALWAGAARVVNLLKLKNHPEVKYPDN